MCLSVCTMLQIQNFPVRGNEEKLVTGVAGPFVTCSLRKRLLAGSARSLRWYESFRRARFRSIIESTNVLRVLPSSRARRESDSVGSACTRRTSVGMPRDNPVSKTASDSGSVSAQITPVMCRLILESSKIIKLWQDGFESLLGNRTRRHPIHADLHHLKAGIFQFLQTVLAREEKAISR